MSELIREEQPQEVRERFTVDNDMKAEWCLSKIRSIRAEQQREKAELERQMAFYRDQIEYINHKADDDAAFFESMLQGYFRSRVDDGFTKATKTKVTYKLPTGELVLKHREPEYDYKSNQQQVLEWLKKQENGRKYIKTAESLDWAAFKKAVSVKDDKIVTADGEIVPGITVTQRDDEFSVEVK